MRTQTLKVASITLAAIAFGCASDDESDADKAGAPASRTKPCSIATGFDGDELCILPPDEREGFQLHYGPANYSDEAEVAPFVIQPGREITDCFYLKSPNAVTVYFNEYNARMRPGSHHLIVYAQGAERETGLSNCATGLDARFFVGSQTPILDVPLPGTSEAPENQGVAFKLEPNTQFAIQLHYINTTDVPQLREAWVNFVLRDEETVRVLMEPIFFIGGTELFVSPLAPGEHRILNGSAPPSTVYRRIMGVSGHYHANTLRFSAWKHSGDQKDLILEDYDWHDPTKLQFDSGHPNTPPDPDAKIAGGWNGLLEIQPGDTISWECEVKNQQTTPVGWGNEVYTKEMCNLFGFYIPGTGSSWSAVW